MTDEVRELDADEIETVSGGAQYGAATNRKLSRH